MSNNRKLIASLVAAAAFAASGSLVYAQTEKPTGPGGDRGEMRRGPDGDRGEMRHGQRGGHERGQHGKWSNPKAAVEGHLAALKVELKITPNQETAWQAFAGKSRQQADAMIARHEQRRAQAPATNTNLTAPERMAQRTERMKQHVAGMEARTAAVKDLYSVLTPEQKAIADKQFSHGRKGGFREHREHHQKS